LKLAAADVLLSGMLVKHALAFSLSLLVSAHALPAIGQEDDPAMRSAGRKLALDGIALFQQGKPAEASQKLEKAYQLLQVPSVALWSARALEQRGLLVEASERYMEASRLTGFKGDKDVQLQAQKDAARELEKLLPRVWAWTRTGKTCRATRASSVAVPLLAAPSMVWGAKSSLTT
jgi:hypothetical protein